MLPVADTLEDGYSYADNSNLEVSWRKALRGAGYRVWMTSYEGKGVYCLTVCYPGHPCGYHVRSKNQVDYLLSMPAPVWK